MENVFARIGIGAISALGQINKKPPAQSSGFGAALGKALAANEEAGADTERSHPVLHQPVPVFRQFSPAGASATSDLSPALQDLNQIVTLLSGLLETGNLKGIPLDTAFSPIGGGFLGNVLKGAVQQIPRPQISKFSQAPVDLTRYGGPQLQSAAQFARHAGDFAQHLPGALGQTAPLFAAGGDLISSLAPLPSQFASLAGSPGFGLIPDPVTTLGSWVNFAQGKGAGQIANAWVGGYFGSKGDDEISPSSLVSFAFGGEGHDTIKGGTGFLLAHGGPGDDKISGATGIGNVLFGGKGDDTIKGGTALFNAAFGGPGDDKITGGTSLFGFADGGPGDDVVKGGFGLLGSVVKGGAGDDDVTGGSSIFGSGAYGGPGDDTVKGGFGVFHSGAHGGPGNDLVKGGSSVFHSLATGGPGNDRVIGGSAWFTRASGGDGDDYVTSGRGKNNVATGDAGHDVVESSGRGKNHKLQGGTGEDILVSRTGKEKVDGGKGYDILYLPGQRDEYHLKQNDKGEILISKYQHNKDGSVKVDKNGQPETKHQMTAKNVESIRFGSENLPVGKLVDLPVGKQAK